MVPAHQTRQRDDQPLTAGSTGEPPASLTALYHWRCRLAGRLLAQRTDSDRLRGGTEECLRHPGATERSLTTWCASGLLKAAPQDAVDAHEEFRHPALPVARLKTAADRFRAGLMRPAELGAVAFGSPAPGVKFH